MSTVTITDITEGATTAITDVNNTNTSWNSATAAGSITAGNIREEGLDRRSIASHAVYSQRVGTANYYASATGDTYTYTGATAVVNMPTNGDVKVGPVNVSGDDKAVVTVSVFFEGLVVAANPVFTIQSSPDNAVWTDIAVSARRFLISSTYAINGSAATGMLSQSCTIVTLWSTAGATTYFRLAMSSAAGNTIVRATTMLVELIAV